MKSVFEVWAWTASFGFLAMLQQFIPREYTEWLRRAIRTCFRSMMPYILCEVHEYDDSVSNKIYQDVRIYLSAHTLEGANRVNMCKSKVATAATYSLANDEGIYDNFEGATLHWVHFAIPRPSTSFSSFYDTTREEKRLFMLRLKKKDKERMLDKYMEHIEAKAKELKREARDLQLYTNSKGESHFARGKRWESVSFLHPANFDTLALDGDLKSRILADLENFAANEDYYKRVGKAWKRGYLLYGPPGTGKSSMIAAIANKMRYDVYDLELTEVESNAQLRRLLLQTTNKSVIVIEDIDCSLDLSGQRKKKPKAEAPPPRGPPRPGPSDEQSKVTLSGLLNFVDGLWSSCGSERIFIFTTNFVEKLDPALLRAGRMDMHIHLSYCTYSAFKVLSENYLEVTEHELFEDVERAFEGTFMTPAEVTEVLIKNQDESPEIALERLIEALGEHREDPRLKAAAEETGEDDEEEKGEAEVTKADEKAETEAKSEKEDENAPKSTEEKKSKEDEELDSAGEGRNTESNVSGKGARSSGLKIVPLDQAEVEPQQTLSTEKSVNEKSVKEMDTSVASQSVNESQSKSIATNANLKRRQNRTLGIDDS